MMETNTDVIFVKKPFLDDLCRFVLPEKSKWKELGIELWVVGCRPLLFMTQRSRDKVVPQHVEISRLFARLKTGSDDGENLEEMFSKWINKSIYSEVSWIQLIEILEKLKLLDVVHKIKEFLKSEKAIKKYENVEVTAFQMPTMKTVYDILHGHKKDYSQILNVRFKSLQASAYKQSEQELLMVFLIFRKLQKNVIQWNDLVEFLYSCKYYDTIEEVFAYLKSKGSSCDKTLKNIMKVDYQVVTLNDAVKVFRPKWNEWFEFGKYLKVDTKYRQQLLEQDDLSDEEKFEAILKKWLELKSSPYYWGQFRSVIYGLDLKYRKVLANSIDEVLAPLKKNCNGEIKETHPPHALVQEMSHICSKPLNVDSFFEQLYKVMSNGAQGIVFILGMTKQGPTGTDVDVDNVDKTFQELNFATYIVCDPTAEEVTTLIKTAALIEYPLTYQYVALYFAGHGGIDEQERRFIVCSCQKKVYIKDAITHPLKCLREKSQTRFFFFDCCLSASYRSLPPIKKSVKSYPGEITAYATNVGEKSWGDKENGGIWTYHLCRNFRELDEPITTILSKTFEDVVKVRGNFQEPLVEGTIGIRKLKQDSSSGQPITSTIDDSICNNTQSRSARGLSMATRSRKTLDNADSNRSYHQVEFSPDTVLRLLKHDSKWWNDFALELDIDGDDRDSLIGDKTLSDEEKMERVIEIWFKKRTCSVSWKKIISVTKELNLTDAAARLEKASLLMKVQTKEWMIMYRILRDRAADYWEDVAVCLEIDDQSIDEMKKSLNKTGNERLNLERVIRQWIDKETSEVSWMKIIRVAWELGFNEERTKLIMEHQRITLDKPANV